MRAALALLLAGALARAAAADEKEVTLAVAPAFSVIHVGDQTAWGGGGGLDVSYGLTDAVALRVTGAFTAQSIDALTVGDNVVNHAGAVLNYFAGAGVTYIIDILRVVPFLDFAVGALGTRRPAGSGDAWGTDLALEIGVGVDYLVSRRLSVGAVVRYHAVLTAITTLPVYLYAGPRVAFHFGG